MVDPVSPSSTYLYNGGEGIDLGFGFNSLEGRITAPCLQTSDVIQVAPGTTVDYYFRLIEDYSSLRTELGISASFSFSGLSGGGSAGFSYQRNTTLTQTSICLLGVVRVRQVPKTLRQWRVSKDTEGILRDQKNDAVFQLLGDQFVSAITLGGDLLLFLTFHSRDSSSYASLHASLEGHVGPVAGSAEFNSKITEIAKTSDIEISIEASGGHSSFPTSIEDAITFIQTFPDKANEKPVVTAFNVDSLAYALLGTGLPPDEVPRLGNQFAYIQKAALACDQITMVENSWKPYQVVTNSHDVQKQATAALRQIGTARDVIEQSVTKVRNEIYRPIPALNFASIIDSLPLSPSKLVEAPGLAITLGATTNSSATTPTFSGHEGEWIRTDSEKGGFVSSLSIQFAPLLPDLSIEYQIYTQGRAWSAWIPAGSSAGPGANGFETNAIAVRLVGSMSDQYSVSYQVSNLFVGDSDPSMDGAPCGTTFPGKALSGVIVSVRRK